MTMIAQNLHNVRHQIRIACAQAGRREDEVRLLAVSKTVGVKAIRDAYAAGQVAFGENYIQEAVEKIRQLNDIPLQWHCIGPIQSNKTRLVAEHFDWVHTIDRFKIAQRLSEQRPSLLPPLQVCIQVNIDNSGTKAGIAPQDALHLAQQVAGLPRLRLRGVMSIPQPEGEFSAACITFARVKSLFDSLNARGLGLDTVSMGMSADIDAAIAQGSTLVRVGTAIFGKRETL